MPEVTISIGGRNFEVACQAGEEEYLYAAAKMLDEEAQVLSDQVGRMPEARMLLMAGLMLADKTASMEDKVGTVQAQLDEREAEVAALKARGADVIEVPVMPEGVVEAMDDLAGRAEALAEAVEEKLS